MPSHPKQTVPPAQRYTSVGLHGTTIRIAPADCRPPGEIADQDTLATGIWACADDGPWHKTDVPGEGMALSKLNRVESAQGALAKLLAYQKPSAKPKAE